jgi:hypothetical protein
MTEPRRLGRDADPAGELSAAVYLRFKEIFGGERVSRDRKRRERSAATPQDSVPYGVGRDPKGLGSVIDSLTAGLGWNSPLAQHDLLGNWAELCGEDTARYSEPVSISDGVLPCSASRRPGRRSCATCVTRSSSASPNGTRRQGSTRSVFRAPEHPPGKEAPGRFQGVVHAILTARKANTPSRLGNLSQTGVFSRPDELCLVGWNGRISTVWSSLFNDIRTEYARRRV